MPRRNGLIFITVLIIFALAALVVLPVKEGTLGKKGVRLGLDLQGGIHIVYRADLSSVEPGGEASAIAGVVAVLENRINPLGVTEPVIQKQGSDRILLELPGLSISDREKENLSRVALLEFAELTIDDEMGKWEGEYWDKGTGTLKDGKWVPALGFIGDEEKALTSRYFKSNTFVAPSEQGGVEIRFEWDREGSQLSEQITSRLLGKPLGIFEEGKLISAPTVEATISQSGRITGMKPDEAEELSRLLNGGRLPVPLTIIYDQTVSPILGADFAEMSVRAGVIGIAIIMLFMIVYYRLSGFIASLALLYYGVLLLAIFKLFGVTLTLAGIGGFILSLGMAIDANVLIFERIKEELWTGRSLGAAIAAGFNRAWPAIWDSNITTILAGVILFWLGSSIAASAPVKGFALTLIIGVAVSMFTAIMVTRTFLRPFSGTGLAQKTWLFAPYQRREKKKDV